MKIIISLVVLLATSCLFIFVGSNKCKTDEERESDDLDQMNYYNNFK